MAVSRNRKSHKQKVKHRNLLIKHQKTKITNKLTEEFLLKQEEEIKKKKEQWDKDAYQHNI